MAYIIKQGDEDFIEWAIQFKNDVSGEIETIESVANIDKVEFYIGDDIRKMFPEDVSFSEDLKAFLVPYTQEETLALEAGTTITGDVRVKFDTGAVAGLEKKETIKVVDATSEEVL